MSRGRAAVGPRVVRSGEAWVLVLLAALATTSCGKSGPPLPPLRLVPDAVTNVVTRRSAHEVRFTFVLPTRNANGPGAVNLDRIEVYAATVAAGALAPPNRELMTAKNLVGTIQVRPPVPEGAAPPQKPGDTRPAPGESATFIDVLDESKLTPAYTAVEPPPVTPVNPPAAAAVATAPPKAPTLPRRIYAIRGMTRGGRPGPPAPRIELPLGELPPPPANVAAKFSESAVTLAWTAPPAAEGAAVQFNVYAPEGLAPLNASPLSEPAFQREGVEFGKEECFVVRSVMLARSVSIESAASERVCVTPSDVFPPAAPRGVSAVGGSGVISLIWDQNSEADLAGYLVLRGEAPGDTLQPLTPAPIKETTFRDTTVRAGVRYVYAIVAVDTATPPNMSPQSTRVEETAR